MDTLTLTPEQEQRADELYQRFQDLFCEEAKRVARLLASKSDDQLLGKTEFELRDRVHELAARSLQTALDERKKGGTRGRP
ncbi:hypothetical protein [Fimbriiglobus ruber]|uniref:Uncharacterized protein n=1 Tax=Fimbriiglobus ruber TaxID=1908690 RepID=A0A225DL97_9BACT|nr:hypothetical protein [Fimbriiglobus ruber]OWK36942.1 hypothetical protein FRUB_07864 [Fimbriiglobus ruber]OWK38636.1 hypothetical protein FRUB_07756 [Fimbriiglobus ruber]OWK42270.1 hypothetical protein FRUB_04348 [Fimbriiglobus ruber]OWK43366.1 hypothetical protein FRUB_02965 [Fimbriiglobus ruber]